MPGKIVLSAINAKYIHSSLALRSINAYCEARGEFLSPGDIEIREFTINNEKSFILSEL
jgi:hypothetical protein